MGKVDNPGIWEKIQSSVQETERLMGQKKYNLSMIKARQTMEFMVKFQCDKAGIVESNTDQMIRELYSAKAISKSTAEHYLQILSLGNKATNDGDNSAYNANQAYHVLSQEIYSFVDADKASKPRRTSAPKQQAQPQSRKRQASSAAAAANHQKGQQPSKSSGLSANDLIKFLIPLALILVLIVVIKFMTHDKTPTSETKPAQTANTTTEAIMPTEDPELPTETAEAPAPATYKTTTTLNVRSGPSTESERLGKLDPDQKVTVLRDYDDFWVVILYNEQEAYVAKQYLTAVTE